MLYLVLGLAIFLGIHSISIINRAGRDAMVTRMGANVWRGVYTVLSLVGFALIVWGYGQARQQPVVLYTPPVWLRHASLLLLVPVFPLLVAAYTQGRIKAAVKHPMLLATKLWAFAHLLSNGTLADVLLFGGFLAWAIADRVSVKKRGVSGASDASHANAAVARPRLAHDLIALVIGLALFGWFFAQGHAWLIGVSPR
jgi:uncharacterized membrane protein